MQKIGEPADEASLLKELDNQVYNIGSLIFLSSHEKYEFRLLAIVTVKMLKHIECVAQLKIFPSVYIVGRQLY